MKMYFLLKMGIFQPAMLVYQRVFVLFGEEPHGISNILYYSHFISSSLMKTFHQTILF